MKFTEVIKTKDFWRSIVLALAVTIYARLLLRFLDWVIPFKWLVVILWFLIFFTSIYKLLIAVLKHKNEGNNRL